MRLTSPYGEDHIFSDQELSSATMAEELTADPKFLVLLQQGLTVEEAIAAILNDSTITLHEESQRIVVESN